ncbi:MAG TPA: glycosyltransferase family A protein [Steroidobacteraceae bacterium]|nr:glycosyltransferase family A protein [Steroidobacteraceae bacterium]
MGAASMRSSRWRVMDSVCVSVVIPTCNRPDLLERCLRALAVAIEALGSAGRIEVVITDDSADDATERMLASRHPWARWVRGPRRGPAANRNSGVAASRGEWVFFLDDDCIPDPLWLNAYFEAFEKHPDCNVFEGKTIADRDIRRLDEDSPVNAQGGYLWSCNMVIRRTLFDQLGGFCEGFPYAAMEDVDMRLRLEAKAERYPFVPAATVCHPYRTSKGVSFVIKSGKSYLRLIERHPKLLGKTPWFSLLLNVSRRGRLLLRDAVQCRFRGFGFALTSFVISAGFEALARFRHMATRGAATAAERPGV